MGERRDKGLGLTRYLTGHTGIPMLSWNGAENSIDAPFPYLMEVTTSRKLQNWHDLIRALPENRLGMAIRYDNGMPSIEQAWVCMHLSQFVPILKAHYDTIRTENE